MWAYNNHKRLHPKYFVVWITVRRTLATSLRLFQSLWVRRPQNSDRKTHSLERWAYVNRCVTDRRYMWMDSLKTSLSNSKSHLTLIYCCTYPFSYMSCIGSAVKTLLFSKWRQKPKLQWYERRHLYIYRIKRTISSQMWEC